MPASSAPVMTVSPARGCRAARDGARRRGMVAGDHHRHDAGGPAGRDRLRRPRARGGSISADKAEEVRSRSTASARVLAGSRGQRRSATASTRRPSRRPLLGGASSAPGRADRRGRGSKWRAARRARFPARPWCRRQPGAVAGARSSCACARSRTAASAMPRETRSRARASHGRLGAACVSSATSVGSPTQLPFAVALRHRC